MKKLIKFFTLSLVATSMLTSCARELSSNIYAGDCLGAPVTTYSGTIKHSRCIIVAEHDRLEENGLGLIAGGVVGGVAGNTLGKGAGNTLATLGGVVAGATAGAMAEKKLKQQQAIEYVIELDDSSLMTIIQDVNPILQTGQKVYVMVSHYGRSRIVAQ